MCGSVCLASHCFAIPSRSQAVRFKYPNALFPQNLLALPRLGWNLNFSSIWPILKLKFGIMGSMAHLTEIITGEEINGVR